MNQQALRTLARFDRLWAKYFRAHPLVKDDKDVTQADLAKYHVVLNTGLTITEREYNGDYGMPAWGDYAIVKVKEGSDLPNLSVAGLFDENWRIGK